MEFKDMLSNLKKGKQVRCKSWNKDAYIQVIKGDIFNQDGDNVSMISAKDLLANNWELNIDWDYVINNNVLCWFWDKDKNQKRIGFLVKVWDDSYSFKFNLDDYNTFEFTNCEPVKAGEYCFY